MTGDATLSWIAVAAPGILARELSTSAHTAALGADTVRDAYLQRATRMVHGYVELRGGKPHYQVEVEDVTRHKMIQSLTADGDIVSAMNNVANAIQPGAGGFSSSNNEAIGAWAKGEDAAAVMLDPDFGLAWLSLCRQLVASGKAEDALTAAQSALSRPSLRSPADRAQIEVLIANFRNDQAGRLAALRELVRLVPADSSLRRTLAEAEKQARQFPEAAASYRAAAQTDPGDADLLNQLGYAEAFAGNLDDARKDFAEYGRQSGEAVNALDSLAEALFINGKFQEAEQLFLQASAKDPAFLSGATLWKAAHARWLAGDLPGADAIAQRYFQQRTAQHDPAAVWRQANWMYETGRRDHAVQILSNPPVEIVELAAKQLAVWNDPQSVPRDLTELKRAYERSAPAEDGLIRTFYASALLRAGNRQEAKKLTMLWPLPDSQDARQALMFPMFLQLRDSLK